MTLEVKNLTKVYKGFRKRFVAVEEVSFRCKPGDVFPLLRPNGAGKTTIIRMLAGITRPTSGSIKICRYDLRKEEKRQNRR